MDTAVLLTNIGLVYDYYFLCASETRSVKLIQKHTTAYTLALFILTVPLFRVSMPSESLQGSLTIVDVAGRVVRTVEVVPLGSGLSEISWNGEDHHGRRVSSGCTSPSW
jgi:flagellar hook assembly protein FlgD